MITDKRCEFDWSNVDGNIFMIFGKFTREAKRAGFTSEEIDAILADAKNCDDYDHAIQTIMIYTN